MTREDIRGALSERQALVCTLFGEAAGEPIQSQLAVGCVIRNRVHADLGHDGKPDWWGESYRGVCLAPQQFSCWWEANANTDRVYALAEALLRQQPQGAPTLVSELLWVATGLMDEQLRDITNDATHYVTAALYRTAPPSWARGRAIVASVGAHVFFRA